MLEQPPQTNALRVVANHPLGMSGRERLPVRLGSDTLAAANIIWDPRCPSLSAKFRRRARGGLCNTPQRATSTRTNSRQQSRARAACTEEGGMQAYHQTHVI